MRKYIYLAILCVFVGAALQENLCHASPIGRVISLAPAAEARRDGETLALKLKDAVHLRDTISTSTTGKVQILFDDDSALTLGEGTVFSMANYAETGSASEFKGSLSTGVLRVITGKVVEMNPKGFSITTPEATIGIRGTIFAVQRVEGRTTVLVENTMKGQVFVNNVLVPAGFKISITPTDRTPQPQPMTPVDRQEVSTATTVAAAPAQPAQEEGPPGLLVTSAETPGRAASDLANSSLVTETMGNAIGNTVGAPAATAMVSGSLTPDTGSSFYGSSGGFSFNVNVESGAISNASMSNNNGSISYAATGGSGSISGGSFTITGFGGTAYSGGSPFSDPIGGSTNMSGSGNISSVGGAVSGTYAVEVPPGWTGLDSGNFSGSRTQ